jgi:hypothetical protein
MTLLLRVRREAIAHMSMRLTSTGRRRARTHRVGLRHDRAPTARRLRVHGFASVFAEPLLSTACYVLSDSALPT